MCDPCSPCGPCGPCGPCSPCDPCCAPFEASIKSIYKCILSHTHTISHYIKKNLSISTIQHASFWIFTNYFTVYWERTIAFVSNLSCIFVAELVTMYVWYAVFSKMLYWSSIGCTTAMCTSHTAANAKVHYSAATT